VRRPAGDQGGTTRIARVSTKPDNALLLRNGALVMSTHGGLHWTNWVQDYMDGCDNPDFNNYRGDFNATHECFQWMVYHLAELGQFHNGRILDIGEAAALSLAANATAAPNMKSRRSPATLRFAKSPAIRRGPIKNVSWHLQCGR
jgi:hypothetical protein